MKSPLPWLAAALALAAPVRADHAASSTEKAANIETVVSTYVIRHSPKGYWVVKTKTPGKVWHLKYDAVDQTSIRELSRGVYVASVGLRHVASRKPVDAEFSVDLKCLVVVLAPWCPHCHKAAANIKALRDFLKTKGEDTRVVVSKDTDEARRGLRGCRGHRAVGRTAGPALGGRAAEA